MLTGLVLAGAKPFQLFASAGDPELEVFDGEAVLLGDLRFHGIEFVILEFDDFIAVAADDVIVIGMIGIIRVVYLVVFAEIHFVDEVALREQRQRAIDSGAGNGRVVFFGPFQKLLRSEMIIRAENGVDDGLSLGSQPEVLALQEPHESILGIPPIDNGHSPDYADSIAGVNAAMIALSDGSPRKAAR